MSEDPRDAEILALRQQVADLARIVAQVVKPRKETWISLPSGQCVPASFADPTATHADRVAMGFRWDGDMPVFPSHWPQVEPTDA